MRAWFMVGAVAVAVLVAVCSSQADAEQAGARLRVNNFVVTPDASYVQQRGSFAGAAHVSMNGEVVQVVVVGRDGGAVTQPVSLVDQNVYVKGHPHLLYGGTCLEAVCGTSGDGGVLSPVVGQRYLLSVSTDSPVRLAYGAACNAYAGGAGTLVPEGAVLDVVHANQPDSGVAGVTCCAKTASATTPIVQLCPVSQ
jgi:hypothetical protein